MLVRPLPKRLLVAAMALASALSLSSTGCDERAREGGDGGLVGTVKVSSTARSGMLAPDAEGPALGAVREGCARGGAIDAVAQDPTCVLDRVRDDAMRDATRRLALSLEAEPPETTGGATSLLRLAITNTAPTETLVVLEAVPAGAVAQPDWKRIVGMPEVRGGAQGGLHVPLVVTTLDGYQRNVDATPMTGGSTLVPRYLGVRLRPGGKLTHVASWWALRIPAPYPNFRDDAGHLIITKTLPLPLERGDYTVRVEVPLFGLSPAERTITTRIHVEPAKTPKVPRH